MSGAAAARPVVMRHRLEYGALRAALGAFGTLGFRRASNVGARIGTLGYAPIGIRRDVVEREPPRALWRSDLHARDQPAEIAIAVAVLDEQRQPRAVGQRELAADQGPDPRVLRGPMQARGAVHAVAIDQRQRRHALARRRLHQRLRLLGALEKRERRLRVQLSEHRGQS